MSRLKCVTIFWSIHSSNNRSISLAREALHSQKDDFAGRPLTFIGDYLAPKKPRTSSLRTCCGLKHLEGKITGEVEQLLKRFSAHHGKAIDPTDDISLIVLNVICALVYGESFDLEDDEFQLIMKYNNHFVRLFKGFHILEMMPWLRYLAIEEGRLLREANELRALYSTQTIASTKESLMATQTRTG